MTNWVDIVGSACVLVLLPVQYPACRLTNVWAPALKCPPILFLSYNAHTTYTHTLNNQGNKDCAATCVVWGKKNNLEYTKIPKPPTE